MLRLRGASRVLFNRPKQVFNAKVKVREAGGHKLADQFHGPGQLRIDQAHTKHTTRTLSHSTHISTTHPRVFFSHTTAVHQHSFSGRDAHDCANESTRCGAKSYAALRDAACGFSLITLLVLLARWFRLESSELSERSCKPSTSRTVWRLVQR